jgi:hypothetical protein
VRSLPVQSSGKSLMFSLCSVYTWTFILYTEQSDRTVTEVHGESWTSLMLLRVYYLHWTEPPSGSQNYLRLIMSPQLVSRNFRKKCAIKTFANTKASSCSKTNQMHLFLKLFILVKRSTCFRRSFLLLPAAGSSCLTYACCCMCSLELLMMDGKTVRNM